MASYSQVDVSSGNKSRKPSMSSGSSSSSSSSGGGGKSYSQYDIKTGKYKSGSSSSSSRSSGSSNTDTITFIKTESGMVDINTIDTKSRTSTAPPSSFSGSSKLSQSQLFTPYVDTASNNIYQVRSYEVSPSLKTTGAALTPLGYKTISDYKREKSPSIQQPTTIPKKYKGTTATVPYVDTTNNKLTYVPAASSNNYVSGVSERKDIGFASYLPKKSNKQSIDSVAAKSRPLTSYEKDLQLAAKIEDYTGTRRQEKVQRVSDFWDRAVKFLPDKMEKATSMTLTTVTTNPLILGENIVVNYAKAYLGVKYAFIDPKGVKDEAQRTFIETPKVLAQSYDPFTTQGRINIGLTAATIGTIGYSRYQTFKYSPKDAQSVSPKSQTTYKTDSGYNIVEKGSFTNKFGKTINYDFRSSLDKGGSALGKDLGSFVLRYKDTSGGLLRTSKGNIVLDSKVSDSTYSYSGSIRAKGQSVTRFDESGKYMKVNEQTTGSRYSFRELSDGTGSVSGRIGYDYTKIKIADTKGQGGSTFKNTFYGGELTKSGTFSQSTATSSVMQSVKVTPSQSLFAKAFPKTKGFYLSYADREVGTGAGSIIQAPPTTFTGASATFLTGSTFVPAVAPVPIVVGFVPATVTTPVTRTKTIPVVSSMNQWDIIPSSQIVTGVGTEPQPIPQETPQTTATTRDITYTGGNTITNPTTTIINYPISSPTLPVPVLPVLPIFPNLMGGGGGGRGKRKTRGTKNLFYTPDLTAIGLGIRGGRPSRSTGLEIRPMSLRTKKVRI